MILLLCSQGGTGPGGVQAATQVPGRQATRPGGPQDQAEPVPSAGGHGLGAWPRARGVAVTWGCGHDLGVWSRARGVATSWGCGRDLGVWS